MDDILLEVNGQQYIGWQDVNVSKSIENLSGQFSFSSTVREEDLDNQRIVTNPIKAQDQARILVNGELLISGTVEQLTISYDTESHTVRVSGRDKTGDLIDSSIIQTRYKTKSFVKLIEAVLKDNPFYINKEPACILLLSIAALYCLLSLDFLPSIAQQ